MQSLLKWWRNIFIIIKNPNNFWRLNHNPLIPSVGIKLNYRLFLETHGKHLMVSHFQSRLKKSSASSFHGFGTKMIHMTNDFLLRKWILLSCRKFLSWEIIFYQTLKWSLFLSLYVHLFFYLSNKCLFVSNFILL